MKSIELAAGAGAGIVAGTIFGFWGGLLAVTILLGAYVYHKSP